MTPRIRMEARSSEQLLALLSAAREAHIQAGLAVMRADGGKMFGVDLLVVAALHRSLELAAGFDLLVRAGNATAAVPLLRLHVDTLLRVWACWLVDRPHDLALKMLEDRPLAQCGLKTKGGKLLHDKTLYQSALVHFPWIESVYRTTSGFVHLSQPAFAQASLGESGDGLAVGIGHRRPWTEAERVEVLEAFIASTKGLLTLVHGYATTKSMSSDELSRARIDQGPQ